MTGRTGYTASQCKNGLGPAVVRNGTGAKVVATNALRTSVRFPMKLPLQVTTPQGTLDALTNNISAN